MKKVVSILFIYLFSVYPIKAFSDQYEKSFFYDFIVQPFFDLDQTLNTIPGLQITHCSILQEGVSLENAKKYSGFGSCLFHEVPVFDQEDTPQKQVIAHILMNNQHQMSIIISWSYVSVYSLWGFIQNDQPLEFVLQIEKWPAGSLSGLLEQILMHFLDAADETAAGLLPFILQSRRDIHTIRLQAAPLENNFVSIEFSLFSNEEHLIDSYSVVTDYYIGADEFFAASKDRYDSLISENSAAARRQTSKQ